MEGCHNRLRKWAVDGTWEKVFTALLAQADAEGDVDWVVSVDSTIVRLISTPPGLVKKGSGRRLKQWRGLATRYDKTATVYLAGLLVASIFMWSAR
ncbi:hypothetical protein ACIQUW_35055 [Streptomyces sp. NPDC101117]|uniref:hypothetical protein n=1 Tax=Streptomyces sp. NPDC101117 TaxID=3366108 RepID=UPI0037FC1FCF